MGICANIMVKNEEARVERCLRSLVPHAESFVVCDSVAAYSPVVFKQNEMVRIATLEELFLLVPSPVEATNKGEEIKRCAALGIEVWHRMKGCRNGQSWTGLNAVIRHGYSGKMMRVNTGDGLVDVTPNHSLFSSRGRSVAACSLKIGDRLLEGELVGCHNSGKGNIAKLFLGSEELAWCWGVFAAEGSAYRNKISGYCTVKWSNADFGVLGRCYLAMERDMCLRPHKITSPGKDGVRALICSGEAVFRFFRERFYDLQGEKRVPTEVLNAPDNIRRAFLEGYMKGDGHWMEGCYPGYTTKSWLLAQGVLWLWNSLGYHNAGVAIRTDKPNIMAVRLNITDGRRMVPDAVKKIWEMNYEGMVYDLSTDDGRFQTGVGTIFAHNTGSTDRTKEVAADLLGRAGRRYHVVPTSFRAWDQARNEALDAARSLEPGASYLMLADADMELRTAPGFDFGSLTADAYKVRQESGAAWYDNVRLVRPGARASYKGVTHEFLAVEGRVERTDGFWFLDHADGANRKDKFDRDIKLLRDGLASDGMPSRYMFYLAQSYRDKGDTAEALRWYSTRADFGGWKEEAWYSAHMAGRCAKALGRFPEFLEWELRACAESPDRAEGWMDLARAFRERGWHELAFVFAERASRCRAAGSSLFVDKAAHGYQPKAEMSISGYYVGGEARAKAKGAAYELLTEPGLPQGDAWAARQNALFYLEGAAAEFPGARPGLADFGVAEGVFGENNPSLCARPDGGYEMVVRSVNYEWPASGPFKARILDGSGKVQTRNWYVRLGGDMGVESRVLMDFARLPPPPYDSVIHGVEDMRLFRWRGRLFGVGMSTRYNREGRCRQVLVEMEEGGQPKRLVPLEYPGSAATEKNWLPFCGHDEEMLLLYRCGPTKVVRVDPETGEVSDKASSKPPADLSMWKGGSQLVPWRGGGWVFAVHETVEYEDKPRVYWHRLVHLGPDIAVRRFTEPFCFLKVGVEYCAGLAEGGDGLVASFGLEDRRAGLCWIPAGALESRWVPVERGR